MTMTELLVLVALFVVLSFCGFFPALKALKRPVSAFFASHKRTISQLNFFLKKSLNNN
jgi:hypothetical protein